MNKQEFMNMFGEYCRSEIIKGKCNEDECKFCPVDAAYNKIFHEKDAVCHKCCYLGEEFGFFFCNCGDSDMYEIEVSANDCCDCFEEL